MDEAVFLPRTMAAVYSQQTDLPFIVYVCVNQPDEWWNLPEKIDICRNNQQTLEQLRNAGDSRLLVIDRSSRGQGWTGKNHGVGWARKVLFDEVMKHAKKEDIIISLDADTILSPDYFQSIADNFEQHPSTAAISLPYYHPLSGEEAVDRAILHYEIYMRNYFLNLHRIHCPYTFTAIGSSIAFRCEALTKIGGFTPVKSGEDFYLLQKLCKTASISNWNSEYSRPAARFSSRVFFGTGPALIKGAKGDWDSYPIYHYSLFDEIGRAYQLIPQLFHEEVNNDFLSFLVQQLLSKQSESSSRQLWQPLRDNFKDLPHFRKAFHEKADALRILQYLKQKQKDCQLDDAICLSDNLQQLGHQAFPYATLDQAPLSELQELRDYLFQKEMEARQESINVSCREQDNTTHSMPTQK